MKFIKYVITRQPIVFFLALVGSLCSLIYINHWEDMMSDNNLVVTAFGLVILMSFSIGMFWYVISLYNKELEE